MRFEEEIYFSKNYEWTSIKIDDQIKLVEQFDDRIRTLYLDQAKTLNNDPANLLHNSFAVGVILFCAIEYLGNFLTSYRGFKNKLDLFLKHEASFNELNEKDQDKISKKIVECFRNGIIHNGRVKDGCQFDAAFGGNVLFVLHNDVLIINTTPFYTLVELVLNEYIYTLKTDSKCRQEFISRFKKEFEIEIKKFT